MLRITHSHARPSSIRHLDLSTRLLQRANPSSSSISSHHTPLSSPITLARAASTAHPVSSSTPSSLFTCRPSPRHNQQQKRGFRSITVNYQSRAVDEFGVLGKDAVKGSTSGASTTPSEERILSDQILRPYHNTHGPQKVLTLEEAMGDIKPLELSPELLLRKEPALPGAKVIDGKAIAKAIVKNVKTEIEEFKALHPAFQPRLAIVQLGEKADSNVYVSMKKKTCKQAGIEYIEHHMSESTSMEQLMKTIKDLNSDPAMHGILVQLPLPAHIDAKAVTEAINPNKDVDGFHTTNIGRLAKLNTEPDFVPCTPKGVLELIRSTGVEIEGKNAVVVGRSDIVGAPTFHLLNKSNATVTLCHDRTSDLAEKVKSADILVVAVGQAELIKGEWLKEGAIVIDVGINACPDLTKKSGVRLVGDVEYKTAQQTAGYITAVPGGVGPMTVAMLMENTLLSARRFWQNSIESRSMTKLNPLSLELKTPVPSDIDIALGQTPKIIKQVAEEIGLESEE
ncbi:tetrahydrofolate synthase, partial [Podila humilis]